MVGVSLSASAQIAPPVVDSIVVSPFAEALTVDSLANSVILEGKDSQQDTVYISRKGGLDDVVKATAKDSVIYDVEQKMVYLYKEARVVYQDMEIEAGYVAINYQTQEMFACGIPDSTGTKIIETPKFKQGSDSYEMETISYNFETKKAKISNIVTQQGEGFLHSSDTKMMADKSINIAGGKYTTCDDPTCPHFYIKMSKAKMTPEPNSKIVFGFSHLVIEEVPMPLFLPFGFFPKMGERSSGILFPSFGDDAARGFSITGLGYYLALGDYADLTTTIDYYTLGSWTLRSSMNYVKRYNFNGGFNITLSETVIGDKGSTDYQKWGDFSLSWNHNQDAKKNPNSQFSASVNISSPTNNQYNGQTTSSIYGASGQSSIRYSKNWEDTPFNMSASFTHSQQMRDSSYTFTLPNLTFNVNTFSPFKRKNSVGKAKLYEDISIKYGMSFQNGLSFKSKEWGSSEMLDKMTSGVDHAFGLTLPRITLLKYITLTPNVSYDQSWYFQSTRYKWNSLTNQMDTIKTKPFSEFGIGQQYSFSAGFNTRLYGMVQFKGDPIVKAIRHVLTPTITLSYAPDQQTQANGWHKLTLPSSEEILYNKYDGLRAKRRGGPEMGSIGFDIGNSLELKLRNRKDTTGNGSRKLKLLERFSIGASYNMLADEFKLSNIRFNGTTNIFDKFRVNFDFIVDPYDIDDKGAKINEFYWANKKGLHVGRLTSFNTSFSYQLSGGKGQGVGVMSQDVFSPHNAIYYADFSVPWSLGFNFSYNFTRTYQQNAGGLERVNNHTVTLNFDGNANLTDKWKVNFGSGYDFKMKKLSHATITLLRDLHCFEFRFSWTPVGLNKSWNFGINVKGSTLRDVLKYDKNSSVYENLYAY